MRKAYLSILAAAIPAAALAQSAIDAQQLGSSDFRGTARFMSMGGAFTALGGDLSVLNQNPGGIGLYRSSEVGATLDIDFQNTATSPAYNGFGSTYSQTKANCNNFGYIGSINLGGALKTFNWGVTYNRSASFNRAYRGYAVDTRTSLSNYVAMFSQGIVPSDMLFDGKNYDPYIDSDIDWLSILAYNSYIINPIGTDSYQGLHKQGTNGDAMYMVRETGGIDEYNLSFGGNVNNVVYWGVSVGITNVDYTRTIDYSESMADANIPNVATSGAATVNGNADFRLMSRKYMSGTGANVKLGVILKPINELRIGFAVHTPTWYGMNMQYDGQMNYKFQNPALGNVTDQQGHQLNPFSGSEETDIANFSWNYRSPWKLMAGVAGVIGGKGIISVDYQYDGFNNMTMSYPVYGPDGYIDGLEPNEGVNGDIRDYFKGSSTLRVGAEYRVTPQFSVRAGYNVKGSHVKSAASSGTMEILTSGVDPSYTFDKTTQHISVGLGYRYKAWYIDAAYIYKHREGTFHAYTNFNGNTAPQSKLTDNSSHLVISTGFKF